MSRPAPLRTFNGFLLSLDFINTQIRESQQISGQPYWEDGSFQYSRESTSQLEARRQEDEDVARELLLWFLWQQRIFGLGLAGWDDFRALGQVQGLFLVAGT